MIIFIKLFIIIVIKLFVKIVVKLIVKIHPTQSPDSEYFKKLITQLNPNVTIYHTEPIQKILESCDTVLTIHTEANPSTIILEGLIMKKPIIYFSLVDENCNFEFIKDKAVMNINYKSDFEKNLKTVIYDNDFRKELIQNGQKHLHRYLLNHGNASEYFAKILNSL